MIKHPLAITRAKGGTAERLVPIDEITIPDLWHLAMGLDKQRRDDVLECWHLAHDLLNTLRELDKHDVPKTPVS
jgi:hypothetical protein